jgi:cell division protein FtsW
VGAGGVFGRGLMAGVQKLFYLPEPHTDFIYAVIGEELGWSGRWHSWHASGSSRGAACGFALRAQDAFGTFVAIGLTTMIVVQAFVNISVVLGLLPTKGIRCRSGGGWGGRWGRGVGVCIVVVLFSG